MRGTSTGILRDGKVLDVTMLLSGLGWSWHQAHLRITRHSTASSRTAPQCY